MFTAYVVVTLMAIAANTCNSKDHSYGGMRLVPGAYYSSVASCMAGPMSPALDKGGV